MNEQKGHSVLTWLHQENRRRLIVALGIAGMLLILVSSWFDSPKPAASGSGGETDLQEYLVQTQKQLEQILSGVQGVGRVSVMLTLEQGTEYRYAVNESNAQTSTTTYAEGSVQRVEESGETQQSYLLIDTGTGKGPLVLTKLPPRIKGVVVVCSGAQNPSVVSRVMDVVTTSLGVTSLQVCVVPSETK